MKYFDEGKHECEIVDQAFDTYKDGTIPVFHLVIVPKVHLRSDGTKKLVESGYKSRVTLFLDTEENVARAVSRFRSLGWSGKSPIELDPETKGFHSFAGTRVELINRYRTNPNNGETYDDFRFPTAGLEVESKSGVAERVAGLFAEKFAEGAETAKPSSNGKKKAPESVAETTPEEIPF